MAAPRKPEDRLSPSGLLIRRARDTLGLTPDEFGSLVSLSSPYVRRLETRESGCSQRTINGLKTAVDLIDKEPQSTVLEDLIEGLQAIRDKESAEIDVRWGAQRQEGRPRPDRGDATAINGKWSAIWQTSRDRDEAVMLETVDIAPMHARRGLFVITNRADGMWLEPERLADHDEPDQFLWEGSGGLFHQWISGHFASAPTGPQVAGSFHLKLANYGDEMAGKWIGVSRDSESTCALLTLGRTEHLARKRFELERHRDPTLPIAQAPQEWE